MKKCRHSNFSLLAFGAIGAIIAALYIQLNPNYRTQKAESKTASSKDSLALDELDD